MAAGWRLTRRGSDIGLKTGFCARLKTGTLWYKGTRRISSLSAWFLLENIVNTSGKVARSVSDSSTSVWCTRVKPVLSNLGIYYQNESAAFYGPKRIRLIQNYGHRLLDNPGSRNYSLNFIRAYSGNGGYQEPLYRSKTGYYDILGVSANATQAQIKTAYYKQSFAYHPDRNAGTEEATLHFSDINEAYTVLGNKALRKKYDRGLLSPSDLTASTRPSIKDTPTPSSAKPQRDPRKSMMGGEESARVFDFDKFFKAHYSEQLQRQQNIRVRKVEMLRKKEETKAEKKMDRMMGFGVGMLLAMAVGILISLKRS